jgi:hypothetical protein
MLFFLSRKTKKEMEKHDKSVVDGAMEQVKGKLKEELRKIARPRSMRQTNPTRY